MRLPRSRGVWIGVGIGVLVVALIVFRVIQASAPEQAQPTVEEIRERQGVPVAIDTIVRGPMEVWLGFSGTVSGVRDAVVRALSEDRIGRVYVEVGQRVSQGQPLVELAGDATRARGRQAESALRQAERRVERFRPLREAGAISQQEWEDALTQLELAREDLAVAREDLVLESSLAGTVTEVTARPGMIPDVGEPLVQVADLSRLVVRIHVSAADARQIEAGQPARVPDGGPTGEVRRVALQADPVTRLVEVEVGFPPGSGLVPGTLERVEIRVGSKSDALQVPPSAINEDVVWVVDEDGRARRRTVTVGTRTSTTVEIVSGLEPGDRVVVEGASLLQEGARVRVVEGSEGGD